jgi:hypothetical protein
VLFSSRLNAGLGGGEGACDSKSTKDFSFSGDDEDENGHISGKADGAVSAVPGLSSSTFANVGRMISSRLAQQARVPSRALLAQIRLASTSAESPASAVSWLHSQPFVLRIGCTRSDVAHLPIRLGHIPCAHSVSGMCYFATANSVRWEFGTATSCK